MKNALIIHGTKGKPSENWFPWLKVELEKRGYKVWIPELPGTEEPKLSEINKFILESKDWNFNSESIIIGHSSGAVAILSLLAKLPGNIQIKQCILVAPFESNSPGGKWEANKSLFDENIDPLKIKSASHKFVLLISDDDPYCPVEYVVRLGKELDADVVLTHNDKHFSVGSGGERYIQLPILLKYIN